MRLAAVLRRVLAVALFFLLLVPSSGVVAQPGDPAPASLTSVVSIDGSPSETHLLITFSPAVPGYSILRNDTDRPAIAFALSSASPTVRLPTNLRGLVASVSLEQQDTILIIKLSTSSPAHLSATKAGGRELTLSVALPGSNPAAKATAATEAAPVAPFPKASVRKSEDDHFVVVPLKYADVSEVVGLLTEGQTVKPNDRFIPREPAFGSAGVGGASSYNQAAAPNGPSDDPLAQAVNNTIAIDRRLNAIILTGPADVVARLKEKIALIDVPVPSVILETIFVELSESGARNVGLDFANANGQLAVATFQTGAFVPYGFGDKEKLSSASLQAAVYAQVQAGEGRVVSKPRISAQSGSSAKIVTGDALPILTSIQLSGVNGVSQQVQYVNVGVTLQIAPRVSEDGFVTSHIFCVVSSVTGFSQGYPTISQREAETSATVRDGETFVIGGLTQENKISSQTHVPLLGRIPLIGDLLFGVDKGSDVKTDLYIVVTPRIVGHGHGGLPASDAATQQAPSDVATPVPNTSGTTPPAP